MKVKSVLQNLLSRSAPWLNQKNSASTVLQTPETEIARLAELYSYQILDTDPERIFNDLAILASEICQTPMAQISLVDKERVWYKSNVGVPVQQLPREITFCSHIVNETTMLIIPDTTQDLRFSSNPIVTTYPKIRFYAGAPLISQNGFTLGSLCVLDKEPRNLSDGQKKALSILAKQTVMLLELHKTSLMLRENNEQFQQEIQSRIAAEVATRHASLHDHLTELPNRRYFEQRLAELIANKAEQEFALLFLDLDKFKVINDRHGHATGDEVLRIVSKRLRQSIRENDHVSRLGGDEFVILIPTNDTRHIDTIANKILRSVQNPIYLVNSSHHISASIGISRYPHDGTDFDSLLNASDKALYTAKNSGKNRYIYTTRELVDDKDLTSLLS